jgi:hypothetical protein
MKFWTGVEGAFWVLKSLAKNPLYSNCNKICYENHQQCLWNFVANTTFSIFRYEIQFFIQYKQTTYTKNYKHQ